MKIERINHFLTLFANIGVLFGIIFLAFELNQNTEMMRAQTRNSIAENISSAIRPVVESPYVADIYDRGWRGDIKEEDGADWYSWAFFVSTNLRNWENEWYQYQTGLFEEEEFIPRQLNWQVTLRESPGFRFVWEQNKLRYSASFRERMDSLAE